MTAMTVGWIFEDAANREGVIYLMSQAESPSATVKVALGRGPTGWPDTIPAPGLVRAAPTGKPTFKLLAGAVGTTWAVVGTAVVPQLQAVFPATNSQALFSYTY
jgi:hypothetical protein